VEAVAARSRLTLGPARIAILGLVAAVALTACGDSGGGKKDAPKTGKAVITELTADQFGALERANSLESCAPLDDADPLLGPIRRSCEAYTGVESGMIAATDCQSGPDCKRVFTKMERKARKAAATGHATDRGVRATGLEAACKHALLTPGTVYRALRQLEAALRASVPRLGNPDDARLEIGGMAKIAGLLPDRGKLLAELRAACR
jgi:hypothetical protein